MRELLAPLDRDSLVRLLEAIVELDPVIYDALRVGTEDGLHRR